VPRLIAKLIGEFAAARQTAPAASSRATRFFAPKRTCICFKAELDLCFWRQRKAFCILFVTGFTTIGRLHPGLPAGAVRALKKLEIGAVFTLRGGENAVYTRAGAAAKPGFERVCKRVGRKKNYCVHQISYESCLYLSEPAHNVRVRVEASAQVR
jgi:hypothetical protein